MTAATTATYVGLGLAAASTASSVAGSLSKAGGAQSSGAAQSQAAMYQAQVARNNQIIAEQNAQRAEQAGTVRAGVESLRSAVVGGGIKAAQAANGIDVNTGSAVDVRAGARMAGKFNAETALNDAQLTAYGYRAKASGFGAEAQLDEMEAGYAQTGAGYASTGALLGGAGSILQNASQLPFGKLFGGSSTASNTLPNTDVSYADALAGGQIPV